MENKLKIKFGEKINAGCLIVLIVLAIFLINVSVADAQQVKYCCERTAYGAWCQDAHEDECDEKYRKTPTSCEATSFCRLGCCYDSSEGICMENTPQKVCDESEGTWSEGKECEIPQCNLGCCILGNEAAFVTLTRCKKLTSFYGLQTDFRRDIGSEIQCIALAALQDEGACVYEVDYAKTCKFATRQECNSIQEGMAVGNDTEEAVTSGIEFYKDYLCSAEELGTDCGPTKKTACVKGKDEVYFIDSCGNPANIYDSSKVNDKAYWRKVVPKSDSCGSAKANINSGTCGNCDYFGGSICRDYKKAKASKPRHGTYICADLNCKKTTDGAKRHGESWCSTDEYEDSVGSRYWRHLCMNGEEIIEPCADFRQEICIEDEIKTGKSKFSQAACGVNRWQHCFAQTEKIDCENSDKYDCKWIGEGDEVEYEIEEGGEKKLAKLACVPMNSPGFKFWEEGESQGICSQANTQCIVKFEEKGFIFGSRETCIENCECLDDEWKKEQLKKCEAVGDCGAKVNFIGIKGNKDGYKIATNETKESNGGLFGLHMILTKLGMGSLIEENQEGAED